MSRLVIAVPPARDFCGRGVLLGDDGAIRLASFRVMARASRRVARRQGNPSCDRMRPFGDPPSGTYVIAASMPPGYHQRRRPERFGRLGALVLEADGGEALRAKVAGRGLLVLHGGPEDTEGRLRPTRGGLRVSDADLEALLTAVGRAHAEGDPVRTVEIVDLALTPSPAVEDAPGRRDLAAQRGPRKPRSGSGPMLVVGVMVAAALARPREGRGALGDSGRRQFLAALALLVGGLPSGGCNSPSPCNPVACDPAIDPTCPAAGYACDYGGAAYGGVG